MFPWKSVFLMFHREDVLLTISPVFTQQEPWSQPEAVDCSSVPGSMYLTFRSQLPCRCWVFKVCVCFCFFLFISKGIALDSAGISLTALWATDPPATKSRHKLLALLKFRELYQTHARCLEALGRMQALSCYFRTNTVLETSQSCYMMPAMVS